ncbi:hypothetical protein BJ742DRAFT_816630 [Cladochytrium replicatum]|nr:hypothetical protein BJ742DRAFT_816630 [Cladochytrium replicatum]
MNNSSWSHPVPEQQLLKGFNELSPPIQPTSSQTGAGGPILSHRRASSSTRQRSTQACIPCRSKRRRCSGTYPCDICLAQNITCKFAPAQRRGPKETGRAAINEPEIRLASLERFLTSLNSLGSTFNAAPANASAPESVNFSPLLPFPRQPFSDINSITQPFPEFAQPWIVASSLSQHQSDQRGESGVLNMAKAVQDSLSQILSISPELAGESAGSAAGDFSMDPVQWFPDLYAPANAKSSQPSSSPPDRARGSERTRSGASPFAFPRFDELGGELPSTIHHAREISQHGGSDYSTHSGQSVRDESDVDPMELNDDEADPIIVVNYGGDAQSLFIYGSSNVPPHSRIRSSSFFKDRGVIQMDPAKASRIRVGSYRSTREIADTSMSARYLPFPAEYIGDLLHIYFEDVHAVFPMVDREKLYQDWNAPATKWKPSLVLLISSMCAVVVQQSGEMLRMSSRRWAAVFAESTPTDVEDMFFRHARAVIGDVFDVFHAIDPYVVQGLLNLTLLTCGTNWLFPPACMLGLAHRIALELGMCRDLSDLVNVMGARTIETYKRTWYCLFLIDKYVTMIEGRSQVVRDGDSYVPLPAGMPWDEDLVQHFLVLRVLGDVLELINRPRARSIDPRLTRPWQSASSDHFAQKLQDLQFELNTLEPNLPVLDLDNLGGLEDDNDTENTNLDQSFGSDSGGKKSWTPMHHVWCTYLTTRILVTRMQVTEIRRVKHDPSGADEVRMLNDEILVYGANLAKVLKRLPFNPPGVHTAPSAFRGLLGPKHYQWVFPGIDWIAVAGAGTLMDVVVENLGAGPAVETPGASDMVSICVSLAGLVGVSKFAELVTHAFRACLDAMGLDGMSVFGGEGIRALHRRTHQDIVNRRISVDAGN